MVLEKLPSAAPRPGYIPSLNDSMNLGPIPGERPFAFCAVTLGRLNVEYARDMGLGFVKTAGSPAKAIFSLCDEGNCTLSTRPEN